jgi:site-specific DNA recombinase
MTEPTARSRLRCAIYTRKSSEEGLEQSFNSLDAQREACAAYIQSQRHQGWILLPTAYDDGGFSGGTMERPALQHLLADIDAARVDTVVVYKVDRLTRSLADFAKIIERFDAKGVSFVSVTQQFSTTSSMGRLTLNMLLSFAQFEREVTGERIRDKIAASKQKGMWMGGFVPLGYEPNDRTLAVIETEAETVRTIFRLYLDLGCVRLLKRQVDRLGLRTKQRQGRRWTGGRPFSEGHLYRILQNPLYRGLIAHRGKTYPGQHPPIIDEATWEAVQQRLGTNRVARRDGRHAQQPSLLAGKLLGPAGERFTPTHAVKQGKRYRYYVARCTSPGDEHGEKTRPQRIGASEIETLVVETLIRLLRSPAELMAAVGTDLSSDGTAGAVRAAAALAERVSVGHEEHHTAVRSLIANVRMADELIRIDVDRAALRAALAITTADPIDGPHIITLPMQLRPRGVELKFVLADGSDPPPHTPDPILIGAIARAHDWSERLLAGKSLGSIAAAEGVTPRYIRRLLDLAFLAPDIIEAVLDGRQPADLTAERLTRQPLPLAWSDQRAALGFR